MREAIVEALKVHPEGLTLRDISEEVGRHRHTITKYVYELIGARVIVERDVGAAKLCYLKEAYRPLSPVGRNSPLEIRKGQAQLAAVFMLFLLLPATAILAMNATNSSLPTEGMLVGMNLTLPDNMTTNTTDGDAGFPEGVPDAADENMTQDAEGSPGTDEDNATGPEANLTEPVMPEENFTGRIETNVTIPSINETNQTITNQTMPASNESLGIITNETAINLTLPSLNESLGIITNETLEEGNLSSNLTIPIGNLTTPFTELFVMLELPDKITRGKESILKANIENRGADAHNVTVQWMIPRYFDILEGSESVVLGGIAAGASVSVELRVFARTDAVLGVSEVLVRAAYE